MTVPAQEWPTSTVGPSCNARMRRVAATSSASEVSGFCTGRRLQADTLQTSNDFGPRGTVRICTMDQDDIAALTIDFSLGLA